MDFTTHAISWNLTRRCNLQCSHCYLDADFRAGRKVDELTTAECFDVIEQVAEVNRGALLILTGGEPLLRPDIYEIAGRAAARGFFAVVATNGTAVTAENARRLADTGIRGVSISLHAEEPDKHDAFTAVGGSWQAAVDAATALREVGLDFVVQTSVMSWNADEIPRIAELSCRLGAKFYNIYFLVCTGRGQGLTDFSAARYEEMLTQVYQMQKAFAGRMLVSAKCSPQYKRVVYEANPDSPFLKSYDGGCPAATHYCQIGPQGEVTPCPYMSVAVGNVRDRPFAEIWRDSPLLQELRDRSLLQGRCGVCEFRSLCSGCRARAYAETGNHLAEDPSCSYQPGGNGFEEVTLAAEHTLGGEVCFELRWDDQARRRLMAIPSFARGMVVKGVEFFARQRQCEIVTVEVMGQAREAMTGRGGRAVPEMGQQAATPP